MKTKYRDDKGVSEGPLRLLVVDDSDPVRRRLCQVLKADRRFEVVGSANNGPSAVRLAARLRPDLVLMDLQMPGMDGLEATRRIRSQTPAPKVIMVTLHDTPASRAAAKAAGADRLISKVGLGKTLLRWLSAMHRRRSVLRHGSVEAKSSGTIMPGTHSVASARAARPGSGGVLTPRERQVVQLIAEGRSSKEVAHRLEISVKTVETHRSNLMRKLSLHSVSKLVRYAIRTGLIEP